MRRMTALLLTLAVGLVAFQANAGRRRPPPPDIIICVLMEGEIQGVQIGGHRLMGTRDAKHFAANGWTVIQAPIESCVGGVPE